MRWTSWRPLEPPIAIRASCLAETLDGGQAFRWREARPGVWRGVWGSCLAELRSTGDWLHWRAPEQQEAAVASELPAYLAAPTDFGALGDILPWRSDAILARARNCFPGLRLLRQPLGETLLGFLLSSNKQIVQIKQGCEALARACGVELLAQVHALPGWEHLAQASESELRACGIGYRAKFLAGTARRLAEEPELLASLATLPYPEARARLLTLPGVGEKVADCVLLFGAGRYEAFPIDAWVARVLAERYELTGWAPAQLRQFARAHFGPLAGLAQQYLFAAERRGKLED